MIELRLAVSDLVACSSASSAANPWKSPAFDSSTKHKSTGSPCHTLPAPDPRPIVGVFIGDDRRLHHQYVGARQVLSASNVSRARSHSGSSGEVDDWTRFSPEALQGWRDRLAAILADERGEIIN